MGIGLRLLQLASEDVTTSPISCGDRDGTPVSPFLSCLSRSDWLALDEHRLRSVDQPPKAYSQKENIKRRKRRNNKREAAVRLRESVHFAGFYRKRMHCTPARKYSKTDWAKARTVAISSFLKKYGAKIHKLRCAQGIDPTATIPDTTTGVIYVLLDECGVPLYVGRSSQTCLMRNSRHWVSCIDKVKGQTTLYKMLQQRSCPLYPYVLQAIDNSFLDLPVGLSRNTAFNAVSHFPEAFWIDKLKTRYNVVRPRVNPDHPVRNRLCGRRNTIPSIRHARNSDSRTGDQPRVPWITFDESSKAFSVCLQTGKYYAIRKRLQDLLSRSTQTVSNFDFRRWSRSWCLRTRSWLRRFCPANLLRDNAASIYKALSERLDRRMTSLHEIKEETSRDKPCPKRVWHVRLSHDGMRQIPLKQILLDESTLKEFPLNRSILEELMVGYRLNPPIGLRIFNFTKTAIQADPLEPHPLPSTGCDCLAFSCNSKVDGHVVGQAHRLSGISTPLQEIFQKGSKTHLSFECDEALDSIDESVGELIAKLANRDTPVSAFSEFRRMLSTNMKKSFLLHAPPCPPVFSDKIKKELEILQRTFVFTPIDKSSHDFGVCCRHLFLHKLQKELSSSAYSHQKDLNPDHLYASHRVFNERFGWETRHNSPYLYPTLKLHKSPPDFRWIAGVSALNDLGAETSKGRPYASSTPAQVALSHLLKAVKREHKRVDDSSYATTGIKRYFVIESPDEAALNIKQWSKDVRGLDVRGYDFKAMYTQLVHTALKDGLKRVTCSAFDHWASLKRISRNEVSLVIPTNCPKPKGYFAAPDSKSAKPFHKHITLYTLEDLHDLIDFCVNNSLIRVGDQFFLQVSGLPMGGNASPDMADLYCFGVESDFIDDLLANGFHDLARQYAFMMRFIDDLLSFGVPPPPECCYKMSYRPTCNALGDVGFMGLRCRNEVRLLHHTPQGGTKQTSIAHCFLRLNVLDKLVEFPYCPIRYCCHDQVAPPKLGSGILTGAIISASRICNNFRDLQTQTIKVVYRLIERGHKRDQLMSAARNAVKSIYGDHDLYNRRLMSTIGFAVFNKNRARTSSEAPSIFAAPLATLPDDMQHRFMSTSDSDGLYYRAIHELYQLGDTAASPSAQPTADPVVALSDNSVNRLLPLSTPKGIPDRQNTCFAAAAIQALLAFESVTSSLIPAAQDARTNPRRRLRSRSHQAPYIESDSIGCAILLTLQEIHVSPSGRLVHRLMKFLNLRVGLQMDPADMLITLFQVIDTDRLLGESKDKVLGLTRNRTVETHSCPHCLHACPGLSEHQPTTETSWHLLPIPLRTPHQDERAFPPRPFTYEQISDCPLCRQKDIPRLFTETKFITSEVFLCFYKRYHNDNGILSVLTDEIPFLETFTIADSAYRLMVAVVHVDPTCTRVSPSIHSGHYIALVRKSNNWFRCNGLHISSTTPEDPLFRIAYLLGYEKIKVSSPPTPVPAPSEPSQELLDDCASLIATYDAWIAETESKTDNLPAPPFTSSPVTVRPSEPSQQSLPLSEWITETADDILQPLANAGLQQSQHPISSPSLQPASPTPTPKPPHGKEPCPFCGKFFKVRGGVFHHIRQSHSDLFDNWRSTNLSSASSQTTCSRTSTRSSFPTQSLPPPKSQ